MRIYFNESGPAVIAMIEEGNVFALAEATFRNTPKVRAAFAAAPEELRTIAQTLAQSDAPAPKGAKASRKAAKPVVDQAAKAAAQASAKAATALREAARVYKTEQYKAGIVVTTDEAYAHVGAVRFFDPATGRKAV